MVAQDAIGLVLCLVAFGQWTRLKGIQVEGCNQERNIGTLLTMSFCMLWCSDVS